MLWFMSATLYNNWYIWEISLLALSADICLTFVTFVVGRKLLQKALSQSSFIGKRIRRQFIRSTMEILPRTSALVSFQKGENECCLSYCVWTCRRITSVSDLFPWQTVYLVLKKQLCSCTRNLQSLLLSPLLKVIMVKEGHIIFSDYSILTITLLFIFPGKLTENTFSFTATTWGIVTGERRMNEPIVSWGWLGDRDGIWGTAWDISQDTGVNTPTLTIVVIRVRTPV